MANSMKRLSQSYVYHRIIRLLVRKFNIFQVEFKELNMENWKLETFETNRNRDFHIELDVGNDSTYLKKNKSPLIFTNHGVVTLIIGENGSRWSYLHEGKIRLIFFEFALFNNKITRSILDDFHSNFKLLEAKYINKKNYIPHQQPDAPTLYTCYSTYPDDSKSQCPYWSPQSDGTIKCLYSNVTAFDQMSDSIKQEDVDNTPDEYFYLWDEISGDCRK